MSKEERYYFDSYDYIVDRQKIINGEEDITVCDFCDWGKIVDILNEQDQKIADLEAKLAKNKKWLASNEGFLENQKLKQQLAEKEKEITQRLVIQERDYNQDKISFALEQLEKVKECLYKIQSPIGEKPTLMDDGDVFEVINNQIKSIKEMK